MTRMRVNGIERTVAAPLLTPLLDVLREELNITSAKAACRQGGCGACTVLVNGEPRRACLLPVGIVDGAEVRTVEGLSQPDGSLSTVQEAFYSCYGSQCGFCTPGMIMAATALLERRATPNREDVVDALHGHLCRCTGYQKILEAVVEAGSAR